MHWRNGKAVRISRRDGEAEAVEAVRLTRAEGPTEELLD
jgi:hypothetical protein